MQAAKNFPFMVRNAPCVNFIAESSATRRGAFYQQMLESFLSRAVLRSGQIDADRLVSIGAIAHRRRQTEVVEIIGNLLIDLPFGRAYEQIARYFQGLCLYRRGQFVEAKRLFESLLPVVHGKLKARTMMALAGVVHDSKQEHSLPYYIEAGTLAARNLCDPYTVVQVGRMTAIHRSLDGDHQGAVDDLEQLFGISKSVSKTDPFLFLEYLNSLAYEKLETGSLEEAGRILGFVLASPLSNFYPECHETRAELIEKGRRASRSVVAVGGGPAVNLLCGDFSVKTHALDRAPDSRADVRSIADWKAGTAQERLEQGPLSEEEERSKRVEFLRLFSDTRFTRSQIDQILGLLRSFAGAKVDQK